MAEVPQTTPPPPATIHAATLASGASGAVEWGEQLTESEAALRRQQGLDIVVRGPDEIVNQRLARQIEAAVGPVSRPQPPHRERAGPAALPHFHQRSRSPGGHSFYETTKRKARKRK
jgi:hypothetical protein